MGRIKKDKIPKEVRDSRDGLKFLIAQRIQKERSRQGLTTRKLADMLGMGRTALTHIETGRNHVNAITLYAIASKLKRPIQEFFPNVPESQSLTDANIAEVAHENQEAAEYLKKAFRKK